MYASICCIIPLNVYVCIYVHKVGKQVVINLSKEIRFLQGYSKYLWMICYYYLIHIIYVFLE